MSPPKAKPESSLIARNKRASFDYDLSDRFEAGIVLRGSEVKMLRERRVDLSEAYCAIVRGEAYLLGAEIAPTTFAVFAHSKTAPRKLLLHRREIEALERATARDGMTAVVTRLYWKDRHIKAEIALARGKKIFDKRRAIRERDDAREVTARLRTPGR